MNQNENSIDASIFIFDYESKSTASQCSNLIETVFKTQIASQLEGVITSKIAKEIIVHLDSVVIDIGVIQEDKLENELALRVRDAFDKVLDESLRIYQTNSKDFNFTKKDSSNNYLLDALELFLTRGYFPNWIEPNQTFNKLLFSLKDDSKEELSKLIRKYRFNENVIKRISYNIEPVTFEILLEVLEPINQKWIQFFIHKLLSLTNFELNSTNSYRNELNLIILKYLLNDRFDSFKKSHFSTQVLKLFLIKVSIEPRKLLEGINLSKDKKSIDFVFIKSLDKINNEKNSTNDIEFVKLIYSFNNSKVEGYSNLDIKRFLYFIKKFETRKLLINRLNLSGLNNLFKFFFKRDGDRLNSVFVSLYKFIEQSEKQEIKSQLPSSINEVALISLLFFENKSLQNVDFEDYFLFLCSIQGIDNNEFFDNSVTQEFISNQKDLDGIKISRLLRDTITKNKIKKSVQNVNIILNNSKPFKNREFSVSKSSYDVIDKFRIKIIKYYLSFGHLPVEFQDLNLYDIQIIFNELLILRNSFLSNIILLESTSSELLIHRLQLILSETNFPIVDLYVQHYFTTIYDYVIEIINYFDDKLNIESFLKSSDSFFITKIILKSVIHSKGKYNPSFVLNLIILSFEDCLPQDIISSESYIFLLKERKDLIKKIDEKESIIVEKGYFENNDSIIISKEINQLRYKISIIQFYSLNEFFPWWSDEKSLDEYFIVLQNEMNSLKSFFEEVFIEKELEGKFMLNLAFILPEKFIRKLIYIFQPFQKLSGIWVEMLNNISKQNKFRDLNQIKKDGSEVSSSPKQNFDKSENDEFSFFKSRIISLKDKVDNNSSRIEKEKLIAHLEFYLRLTPNIFFDNLSSQIWSQIVFSFFFEYVGNPQVKKNKNLHESLIFYLKENYPNVSWDDFFIATSEKSNIGSISDDNLFKLKRPSIIQKKHIEDEFINQKDIEINFIKILNEIDFVKNKSAASYHKQYQYLTVKLSVLQFYAKHKFLPWWANESSFKKYFISLTNLSILFVNLFEEIVLQIEAEDHFLADLAYSLPNKQIEDLKIIFRPFHNLNSKWNQILVKHSLGSVSSHLNSPTSGEENEASSKEFDSLTKGNQNQFGFGNEIEKGTEEDQTIDRNGVTINSGSSFYLMNKQKLRHMFSVLKFYAWQQFLPWWSSESSLDKFFVSFSNLSISVKHVFEEVFHEIESDEQFLADLAFSLPNKHIEDLKIIFRPFHNLNSNWNEILLKHSLGILSYDQNSPTSGEVKKSSSKEIDSLNRKNRNQFGSENEIEKGIELNNPTSPKSFSIKSDSISYLQNKARLLQMVSALQFFAKHEFLPWWSEEVSLGHLFRSLENQKSLFDPLFEEVFLEKEVEEQFLEKLSISLPEEFLKRLTRILKPYQHLRNRWEECLIKNSKKDQSKNIDQTTLANRVVTISNPLETSAEKNQDFNLLKKNIYFLKDKEILDSSFFNKEALKGQLEIYLKLAPFFYFRNLTPQKWREYVFSFALWYGNESQTGNNTNFHKSLFEFLEREYRGIRWENVLIQVLKKVQLSPSFNKKDFPLELLSLVDKSKNQGKIEIQKQMEQFNSSDEEILTDEIRILNAGLIIIWPFFTRLFEQLELMNNGEFLDTSTRNRAIYILQYLAYNHIEYPEYELVLNKILVGMPIQDHVKPIEKLTLDERNMASSLMKGLILNWEKVKNSSIDGIQETFFQREGWLSLNRDYNKLMIPKKGVDVLVESIPWNLSLIKQPWMEKPLHIEWI